MIILSDKMQSWINYCDSGLLSVKMQQWTMTKFWGIRIPFDWLLFSLSCCHVLLEPMSSLPKAQGLCETEMAHTLGVCILNLSYTFFFKSWMLHVIHHYLNAHPNLYIQYLFIFLEIEIAWIDKYFVYLKWNCTWIPFIWLHWQPKNFYCI